MPIVSYDGVVGVEASFKALVIAMYLTITLDIFLQAYTDLVYSDTGIFHVVAFAAQLCVLLAESLLFYVLLSGTFLVKKALFRRAFEEFRGVFYFMPLYYVVFLSSKMTRLAFVYTSYPYNSLWGQTMFSTLYALQKLVGIGFYASLLGATRYLISEPKLYTSESARPFRRTQEPPIGGGRQ